MVNLIPSGKHLMSTTYNLIILDFWTERESSICPIMEKIAGVDPDVLAKAMANGATELLRQQKRDLMDKTKVNKRIKEIVGVASLQTGTTPQQMGKYIREQEKGFIESGL